MITQIADRLILQPTRNPVSALGKVRRMVRVEDGYVETWTQRIGANHSDDVDVFVLKFSGSGGRAERCNHQPLDSWTDLRGEIWSVNPPGYGGSSGRASLGALAVAGRAVYDEITKIAAGRPLIVMGDSLGTVSALFLAANFPVHGIVLRNPPPLRQLIVGKHGWWNLWLGAMLVSTQVPDYLCSIENAARCFGVPAVFVGSTQDRIVPPHYQVRIVRAYAGPKKIMRLRKANHSTSMTATEQIRYGQLLGWLRERALAKMMTR